MKFEVYDDLESALSALLSLLIFIVYALITIWVISHLENPLNGYMALVLVSLIGKILNDVMPIIDGNKIERLKKEHEKKKKDQLREYFS